MRKLFSILSALLIVPALLLSVSAATHTVVSGDSLWKIATKYQVGLSEIKSANPQIKNFDLIYQLSLREAAYSNKSYLTIDEILNNANAESDTQLDFVSMNSQLSFI